MTARKTILVIEDQEFNRDLLVQILMDFGMPVMDGWEATRRIKAEPGLRHIPIIAITSHAMVGDEEKARRAGCDDYMAKPIHEDELLAKIRHFIG
jgi:two-component system cell cycle response regulator DivK